MGSCPDRLVFLRSYGIMSQRMNNLDQGGFIRYVLSEVRSTAYSNTGGDLNLDGPEDAVANCARALAEMLE